MADAQPDRREDHDQRALAELGQAVRSRRSQLGLTLSQVAERSGLSAPFLSQVETSFAAPSLVSLFAIARVLDTTPERLLAGPVSADVVVTPRGEGQRYPVTDAARGAFRRQLTGLGEPFSAAESFFSTLQHERLSRRRYATRAQARRDVAAWIDQWYNRHRRHSSADMLSPVEHEQANAA